MGDLKMRKETKNKKQIKRDIFLQNKSDLETLLALGYQFPVSNYKIKDSKLFGKINDVGVHQRVDINNPHNDIENALNNFHKGGFSQVIFYI